MARNRNKYSHLIIQKTLAELPIHIIESIIKVSDIKTQAKISITNKYFNSFIGDIRPNYIINQTYFIKLLQKLCENQQFSFFTLRLLSKDQHIVISDENNYTIYMYIIDRHNRLKTITRSYSKHCATQAFKNLFNKNKRIN